MQSLQSQRLRSCAQRPHSALLRPLHSPLCRPRVATNAAAGAGGRNDPYKVQWARIAVPAQRLARNPGS